MITRYLIFQLVAAAAGAYLASRKGRGWVIWGLLCFIFPPFIVLLLVLPPALAPGVTKRCPECGRIIPYKASVCGHCKRALPIEMVECPGCGKYVPEGRKCPDCVR